MTEQDYIHIRATRLKITAIGHPAPQGSKRHVGHGVMIEASQRVKPWRETVVHAARQALADNPLWDRGAAHLTGHMVFTLPRPQAHHRTGKYAHLLRDNAPTLHGHAPDLSKLVRAVEDALTDAGVWVDDSRLGQLYAIKTYPGTRLASLDVPGVRIILEQGDS